MNKIVLFCLSLVIFLSCVHEDMDDCDAVARFIFTHDHSVEEFDTEIANDVYLHVYQDYTLLRTDIVPYDKIKGGQEVILRDYKPGEYCVVAWAVPAGTPEITEIPTAIVGSKYQDQLLAMPRMTSQETFYEPIGEIFLGEETVVLEVNDDDLHEISLSTCISRVYFTLHNANLIRSATKAEDDEIWVEVEGVRAQMSLDRISSGIAPVIYRNLVWQEVAQTMFSGMMGVIPSTTEQLLTATVYKNGSPLVKVETNERAVAGSEIWIDAYLGTDVHVYIDGWRVRNASVTHY